MRKSLSFSLLAVILIAGHAVMAKNTCWKEIATETAPSAAVMPFHPKTYKVYRLDVSTLKSTLINAPSSPNEAVVVTLPMADGSFRDFKVWEESMMEATLAAKYPGIKTYSAVAANDVRVTAKLDFTLFGFHAMIIDGDKASFIDPYDIYNSGYYFAHYKTDEVRSSAERMKCEYKGNDFPAPAGELIDLGGTVLPRLAQRTANGWTLRTYRLALSANHFYCQAATGLSSPSIAQCLSVMTTTINRVNQLYERDFSVHLNFCANEDTLIWNLASGGPNGSDPFSSINSNGSACLSANQTQCDNRIGRANYDLGHVFTTGGGGISSLGVVCTNSRKAESCTGSPTPVGDGFDLDYVAHEMGHEFGSDHTFNNNSDGSCSGNAVSSSAYEPGSGATIMDYAGICSPDDLQNHSDFYFSFSSLQQIQALLTSSAGTCAANTSTGNKLVSLASYTASYAIPYKTPFELIGPTAVDSVSDTATTYCWAQYNRGDFGKKFVNTFTRGPIFRSYQPVYTPTRIFPKISMVLTGVLSNAGTDGAQGEKAPDTARFLTFKMTVRNILNGKGCFLIPDDTIHLDAIATPTKRGFKVTSQSTTGVSYTGGSSQTITWDVVGTTSAPINCATVNIYMSTDGGLTWPYTIGNFPNNGTATVTVPNPPASSGLCRFKVKGDGNVFFNINSKGFTVTRNTSIPVTGINAAIAVASFVNIYPVPATQSLNIDVTGSTVVNAIIYNTTGQKVWEGSINGQQLVNVSQWARGIYYVTLRGEQIMETRMITVE